MASPPVNRQPPSTTANMTTPRNKMPENTPGRSVTSTPPSAGGLARNPSLRGARPVRRAPARASIGGNLDDNDDGASKSANDELVANLRQQLERAEQASEQYRKQLEVLQQKIYEANDLQTAAEERDFAAKTQIDKLLADVREHIRQKREMELTFESERNILLQEKDRTAARETELQAVVNRLTDTLKTRSLERQNTARMETMNALEGIESSGNSGQQDELMQAIQERDNAIETLKLELADFHLRAAEQEHMGDGRQQALEKELRDTKMQNARLLEENDSFQMLLSEKTLKGDFMHDANRDSGGMSSLAEELEDADGQEEISTEGYRKLETDLKTVREEKKALTLYIDKIIGRLLQHEGLLEHIITGKDADEDTSMPPPKLPPREKPLPAAPSKAPAQNDGADTPITTVGGFLQRARSVVSRAPVSKPRPLSQAQHAQPQPHSANENPQTAPSIPFNKGHRRARSDQASQDFGAPAQTNKGSPLRAASGSPTNQVISPPPRSQTAYFVPPGSSGQGTTASAAPRAPSQAGTADRSSSASIVSEHSFERQSTEGTSYPASTHTGSKEQGPGASIPGAVMKQNQLRPLRLVQETGVDEEAMKRANRSSWMGWFNKNMTDTQQQ